MSGDPCVLAVEVVSPLFTGGADPRGGDPAAEGLRVPSLRGALRYWLRAVLAAPDPDRLREQEHQLFGSVEVASPAVLRTWADGSPRVVAWRDVRQGRGGGLPGVDYLGAVALRETRDAGPRRAIAAGARFRLEIGWRAAEGPSDRQRRLLAAALWLMGRFGSLGSRARRGFGAIQFTEVVSAGFLEEAFQVLGPVVGAPSPGALRNEIETAAAELRGLRGNQATREYPNLSVAHAFVFPDGSDGAARPLPSWDGALDRVGQVYREFRREVPVPRRIPFGLPIPMRGRAGPQVDDLNRRASPLRFRPVRLASGGYAIAGLRFEDRLFPKTPADHAVVRRFVTEGLNAREIPL